MSLVGRIATGLGNVLKYSGTEIILRVGGEKALHNRHLATIADDGLRKVFQKTSSVFDLGTTEERKMYYSMMDDIIQKLQMCSDEKVKTSALEMIKNVQGKSNQEIFNTVCKAENLIDSVNMAENKYSTLFDARHPMGSWGKDKKQIKVQAEQMSKAIENGENEKAEDIAEDLYSHYSQPRQAYYALKRSDKLGETLSDQFKLSSRFSRMKEYFINAPEEKEMAEYLYKKYFIEEMKKGVSDSAKDETKEIVKLLKAINKKYKTKVFLDAKEWKTKDALDALKDEFGIWKKTSKGKAEFPLVYDSNRYAEIDYINKSIVGMNYSYKKLITTKDITHSSEMEGFHTNRHEMMHQNDKNRGKGCYDKITIPEYQKKEMEKAGISKEHIEYAETDMLEKRAVWLEGDTSKYSQKFKDKMVEEGMERYMTEMPTHSQFFEETLTRKYADETSQRIIDEIKEAFDGIIPSRVSKAILRNKEMLTVAEDVIKEKCGKYDYDFRFIFDCKRKLDNIAFEKELAEIRKPRRINAETEQKSEIKIDWKEENKKILEEIESLRKQLQEQTEALRTARETVPSQKTKTTLAEMMEEAEEDFEAPKTFMQLYKEKYGL